VASFLPPHHARSLPESKSGPAARSPAWRYPDDDLHAAGTLARLRRAGNDVHLVMYTNDDRARAIAA
jgi:hypothetical protein